MSTILLTLYPVPYPTTTARFLTESLWTCYSAPPHTWRQRSDSILATGEPLSIIPRTTRDGLDPEIIPAPGWKGLAPTWMGVPCHVGRVTLWLPTQETLVPFRPFSMLTLLPQHDVPDASPFIQLGVQFLLEYHVQVVLNETATGGNYLLIP